MSPLQPKAPWRPSNRYESDVSGRIRETATVPSRIRRFSLRNLSYDPFVPTTVSGESPTVAPLSDRVPPAGTTDGEEILGLFLDWVADTGLTLYPAQEEALLEIMAGKHVILGTPTGSGKSLVALGLHFKALCEGQVSFYTSPIKALASEKFFSLCAELGPENVGMLTGDASINPSASVLCCTAEALSNMAPRPGGNLA